MASITRGAQLLNKNQSCKITIAKKLGLCVSHEYKKLLTIEKFGGNTMIGKQGVERLHSILKNLKLKKLKFYKVLPLKDL